MWRLGAIRERNTTTAMRTKKEVQNKKMTDASVSFSSLQVRFGGMAALLLDTQRSHLYESIRICARRSARTNTVAVCFEIWVGEGGEAGDKCGRRRCIHT
jgi:hypothetical protein